MLKDLLSNGNLSFIIFVSVINSFCIGLASVFLPAMVILYGGNSAIIGTVVGIQAILGIFIFLPQAEYIKKHGEQKTIRIGVLLNVLVYVIYLVPAYWAISIGKFVEETADRLLNSSVSKSFYDITDNNDNRGKLRALIDALSNISQVAAPSLAAILLAISLKLPIILSVMILLAALFFSKKINLERNAAFIDDESSSRSAINRYYLDHIKKYFGNKPVVLLTIPSVLMSCLDIFYSLLLSLYLLSTKGFDHYSLAWLWSMIAIVNILIQIPSGYLADQKRGLAFVSCAVFTAAGMFVLISPTKSRIILIFAVLIINAGCVIYTTSMSVLFGDCTTREGRLSESESYRMFRNIFSGLFSILLSNVFDTVPEVALIIIAGSIIIACGIAYFIDLFHNRQTALRRYD